MTQEANDKVLMTGQPELATFAGDGIQVCRNIDEEEIETCFERLWVNSKATAEKRLARRSPNAEAAGERQLRSPTKDPKSPPLSGAEREQRRQRLMSLCRPRQPPAWTCADTFMPVLSSSPALRRKATCSFPPIQPRPSCSPVRPSSDVYDALLEGDGAEASKEVEGDQKENDSDEEDDNEEASEDGSDAVVRENEDEPDTNNPEDEGSSSEDENGEEGDTKDAKAKKSARKKKRLKKKKSSGKITNKASPKKTPLSVTKRAGPKPLPANTKPVPKPSTLLATPVPKPALKKTASARKSPTKKASKRDLAGKPDAEGLELKNGENNDAPTIQNELEDNDGASHDAEEVSLLSGSHSKGSRVDEDSDEDLADDEEKGSDVGDDGGEEDEANS